MEIDKSLKSYNSFGFDIKARGFVEFSDIDELPAIFEVVGGSPFCILGGGSNSLFTSDYDGVVIHPIGVGVEVEAEYRDYTLIRVEAGVEWDAFVGFCVDNNLYGAENLSGIPGSVGASPVQNIGAYGVEAKDIIEAVECYDIEQSEEIIITNDGCKFGYRSSIFKGDLRGRVVVTAVLFRLNRVFTPNLSYKALSNTLPDGVEITARLLRETILSIRDSKLPDPKVIGNGGSFFKNPVITAQHFERLKEIYPDIVSYTESDGVKVPAGWLIEKAGWRGYREGSVGVHDKQALVLVHFGEGKGADLYNLASKIIKDIESRFDIVLTPEVNIY